MIPSPAINGSGAERYRIVECNSCDQLKKWLHEAECAYHALQTGSREEQIQHDGKLVRYTPASEPSLLRYIAGLKDKVDACTGVRGRGRRIIGLIPR